MIYINKLVILILFTIINSIRSQNSPCPRLFRYLPNDATSNRFRGEVLVQSKVDLIDGVFLVLLFDRPSKQLGATFGDIYKHTETDYVLRKFDYELKANTPLTVTFYVEYDPNFPAPNFVGFRLNGRTKCPDPQSVYNNLEFVTSGPSDPIVPQQVNNPSIFNNKNTENNIYEENTIQINEEICGTTVKKPVSLIANGQAAKEGNWPWHAAIYRSFSPIIEYTCGGTLITKRHILTAGHCVIHAPTKSYIDRDQLIIYLGKYNLRYHTDGIQQKDVSAIYIHPNFNLSSFTKNDITILKLSTAVKYTDYVRPICLWQENQSLESILNKLGTVVGWGFSDVRMKPSDELQQTQVPVVSTETCILSYASFYGHVLNGHNYCAGYENGTTICNGDSGGGMFFPISTRNRNSETKWQIRGIVSLGVPKDSNVNVCQGNHYTVFTDVTSYLFWIQETVKK